MRWIINFAGRRATVWSRTGEELKDHADGVRHCPISDVSFRQYLRNASHPAHDAAELTFAPFLADPQRELPWFLATQWSALRTLQVSAPQGSLLSAGILQDLLRRLDADLADLRIAPPSPEAARPLDPLAVDYLVLGSRHGTEVLRRRLFGSPDSPPARGYFTKDRDPGAWQALCAALDRVDPDSPRAARILFDTASGFDLFAKAAAAARLHLGTYR